MTRFQSVTGHAAFTQLNQNATSVRGRTLRIRCAPLTSSGPEPVMQLAFAIGRSFGPAVQRNRARRRIRAALVTALRDNDSAFDGRFLIGANRSVLARDFVELQQECCELITSLKRRCHER